MLVMCLGVLLMFGPALAKEISFGGQVRPRAEFRDPAGVGYDVFTSMRVRAQMVAKLDRNVDAFVQIQDVRLWGEEGNTLGDFKADKFDLHQGYVTLNKINDSGLSIRAGRQAIAFGGQRLVGSVEWTQQGRVFDGLRATIKSERSNIDIIGIRLAEASSATHAANAYFWGAYANFKAGEGQAVDAFALYNRVSGGVTDQYTLGIRLVGKTGTVSYRAEGAFQTGERGGNDVSAYMFGARAGTSVGKGNITLWYDYLSGDDDTTDRDVKVFDTLFATNHKFYGFADLFLNIPVHTGGLGLQDAAVKVAFPLAEGAKLAIDGHVFLLAKKGAASSKRLGQEVDATLSYKYSGQVTFVGGFSYVIAKKALADIGRLNDDMKFSYLMMNVAF
jgi:hypothetical protein